MRWKKIEIFIERYRNKGKKLPSPLVLDGGNWKGFPSREDATKAGAGVDSDSHLGQAAACARPTPKVILDRP